ncbi:Cyclic nucleotide-gated cation channel alpha-3 [Schistosoma japonicum]|uniref:Cyclic nucleotide-gated cation channel alpha-3 n=1 Tax=Schistosoma japonicum TaxID=6182 RepID=A0A4Z2DBK0_SCHJA|nr:Cyclic nucleotide-gated cation channel alpha-3 [Schistosoma japonicum]
MNTNVKNCNLPSEKIIYSMKDDNTTDNISSVNSVNKNWKNIRHTMKFVLSNKSKTKSEYDDCRRDSFMNRFSTQRRGSYTHEHENINETQLPCYQPSFRIKNNNKAQTNDCTQNEVLFESLFNRQPEIDDKQHEIEYLIKSFKRNSIVDNLLMKSETESNDTNQKYTTSILKNVDTSEYKIEDNTNKSLNWMKNIFIILKKPLKFFIFHSNSSGYLIWLTCVSLALLYNLWAPIARQAFTELQTTYNMLWFSLDILADITYLIDIFVQCNTSYLKRGLKVRDHQKLAKRYIKSYKFLLDIFSLLPLDLLQLKIGIQPMLRFPRFLKWYRCREWKIRVENRTIFPNLWRVLNLIHILFLGCHWFAAFYYLLSKYEGFKNPWGYQPNDNIETDTISRIYLKSFYWATLTLTTIGDLSAPTSSIEIELLTSVHSHFRKENEQNLIPFSTKLLKSIKCDCSLLSVNL